MSNHHLLFLGNKKDTVAILGISTGEGARSLTALLSDAARGESGDEVPMLKW